MTYDAADTTSLAMNAPPAKMVRPQPWRLFQRRIERRFRRWSSRVDFYPRLEIAVAALTLLIGLSSYAFLTNKRLPAEGLSPPFVTALVVVNLLPLMALLVLIARRLAILLSNRRQGLAGARLHIRLVALFAGIAAVPTLLVVVFASLLFQFGVQFWFSDRARTVLDNADRVAQAYVAENKTRLLDDVVAMARDVRGYAVEFGVASPSIADGLAFQLAARNLSEAAVFTTSPKGITIIAATGLDSRPLTSRIQPRDLIKAGAAPLVIASSGDRIEAVVRLDAASGRYLYASRKVDPQVLNQVARTATALSDYKSLIERSRLLQWRFNLIMVVVSLIILAVAIWFALWLANRLVTPIGALADAAERVGAGDLDARVPVRGATDEIATLSRAFNRMTGQLKAQQSALVSANSQLDRRRQFTEAVLSGVSAGVLSVDSGGFVRLANQSAAKLLQSTEGALAGTRLRDVVPELTELLAVAAQTGTAGGQVRIARGNDTQTLVVQIAAETGAFHTRADASDHGQSLVVTFDDISEQLADQRSAAWADVARRIAHEIKNPLTPIQLSAERLQRKYGPQIATDPETFASLTGTIVRQVGDLRRMVDEFSEFARMPKPVFRTELVLDLLRQTLFLHEIGYPTINFRLDAPGNLPGLECDRRQITQALTNLLKNAAEAVLARVEADELHAEQSGTAAPAVIPGEIVLAAKLGTGVEAGQLVISVTDNGVGLPLEQRDRLTEPYVTTRARGTGLGLAIVKKIVEEHGGTLELGDAPASGGAGRGAVARLHFDLAAAARLHVDRFVQPVTVPAGDAPAQATIIQFKQQG